MREITPFNNNGGIQLKFSWGGKRYSFTPIPGGKHTNKRHLDTSKAIAVRIQNDILAGHFDPTLDRYRLSPKTPLKPQPNNLLELWDLWVASLELPVTTTADHYKWVRKMIVKAKPGLGDTKWLTESKLAPVTYNDRLSYLKSCGRWAVDTGLIPKNPFDLLKSRKVNRKPIQPFTLDEIREILKGFEGTAPHYVPFVKFLFLTGVRLSEAIGLRWGHVDFYRNELTICESLSRDILGNGYSRIRKETKTGSIRCISFNSELRTLLESIKPSRMLPDSLIFRTPEGCIIDASNFRARYWQPILLANQIPYRKIHTIRHTTLSHAIEQGVPLTGVAYLAGHVDTRAVMQTYGHMVNRPKLPDLPI